ncbi:MAG: type VI secretion system domain-containing protein, partial [Deltaproteobacteria bacterium]|nr:type VI secretion system domain-containing protein [Deltaproteobacteria bacterium]
APAAAAAAPATPAAAPAGAAPAMPPLPDKLGGMEEGLEAVRRVVDLLRGLAPSSPLPYRLGRVIKWEPISELPQGDAAGKTLVPGPRDSEIQPLSLMAQAKNWPALVQAAEAQFLAPGGTFLLDLQRLIVEALKGQGFEQAADTVTLETGAFLNRLPELATMTFASGRPFADPQTRQWLSGAQSAAARGSGAAGGQEEAWRGEALTKAGGGDLAGGLAVVQEAARRAPDPRSALECRLAGAELCLDFGRPKWAGPILEGLAQDLDHLTLAVATPGLAARVWGGLVRVRQAAVSAAPQPTPEDRERLARARDRLFQTDLALAAKLAPAD